MCIKAPICCWFLLCNRNPAFCGIVYSESMWTAGKVPKLYVYPFFPCIFTYSHAVQQSENLKANLLPHINMLLSSHPTFNSKKSYVTRSSSFPAMDEKTTHVSDTYYRCKEKKRFICCNLDIASFFLFCDSFNTCARLMKKNNGIIKTTTTTV